jgi:glycine cleavage system aminomethyltransferase T
MPLSPIGEKAMESERVHYELMLNALGGIEDDLVANRAPVEAIRHVQDAVLICKEDFKRRFFKNTKS